MSPRKTQPPKYPLVRVEWHDAESDDAWKDVREVTDSPTRQCVSVGWLILKTAAYLILASDLGLNDTDTGRRLTIPRGWVKRITTIHAKGT